MQVDYNISAHSAPFFPRAMQKNEVDAYDLRHRMQEAAEEMRARREAEERAAR